MFDIEARVQTAIQEAPAPIVAPDLLAQLPDGECFVVLSSGPVWKARLRMVSPDNDPGQEKKAA